MNAQYDSSLAALRLHFVQSLLDGRQEISEEEAQIRKDSLNLDSLKLPCVVACIAPYYNHVDYREKDRMIHDCARFVRQYIGKHGYSCFCCLNSHNNIQLILHTETPEDIEELLVALRRKMQTHFGLDLFIGIGSRVESYARIAVSATEATEMLAYKFQYAERGVINIANIVRFRYNISNASNEMFDRVIGCFQDGDLGKMMVRLESLIAEIRYRPNVSRTSIKRTLIELTVNILHIASNANVDVDAILAGEDPYNWILQQDTTPAITEWFLNMATRLREEMREQQNRREKGIIRTACDYIDENIKDNALGLQAVSEKVGLSTAYFSQLFKTEMDIGVNNYIARRRIELAMELLRDTDLKNKDIALQLGFARENYFSSVFKKMIGMPPGEYRKKQRKMSDNH